MWYGSSLGPGHSNRGPELRLWQGEGDAISYAISKDGLNWEKPDLGIFHFDDSLKNNIVYDMHSPSVIYDVKEKDPAKRYKMVGVVKSRGKDDPSIKAGYSAAYSPDGLHWTGYPDNPILKYSDTITLMQHPRTGEYFASHKRPAKILGYDRLVLDAPLMPAQGKDQGPAFPPVALR